MPYPFSDVDLHKTSAVPPSSGRDSVPDSGEESTDLTDVLPASSHPDHQSLKDLKCQLETKDLWKKFHELGTEMIITKSGRLVEENYFNILYFLLTKSESDSGNTLILNQITLMFSIYLSKL